MYTESDRAALMACWPTINEAPAARYACTTILLIKSPKASFHCTYDCGTEAQSSIKPKWHTSSFRWHGVEPSVNCSSKHCPRPIVLDHML